MTRHMAWLSGLAVAFAIGGAEGLTQRGAPPAGAPAAGAPQAPGRTPDVELLRKFDRDTNGWLGREERQAARTFLAESRANAGGRGGGGRGGPAEPVPPGPRLTPSDVPQYAGRPLYQAGIVRTLFLEFEDEDWEDELAAFYHTDVELPATLRVDGRTYANVGVQFRGNSSFRSVAKGRKRSLSLSLDHVNDAQALEGYRALTLLNAHSDPTFLRSVLYLDIVKDYIPALKANYARVVVNGESWGIYVNQQRYNNDFLRDAYGTDAGIRFKSSNRSRYGALSYLGEDPDEYRRWYEIMTADRKESWSPLITLARVLHETPPAQLRSRLEPIFDIDGALRYLALDIVMMSGDGYWLHGSDYNLYVDPKGILHILHHDTNEAFTAQGGGRAGPPPNAEADPFTSMDDPNKALRQKLLVVPEFRTRYLEYVRDIARDSLDWGRLAPKIEAYQKLIGADVSADTRKLYPTEQFRTAVYGDGEDNPPATTLKGFLQLRRAYLLNHPAIKALGPGR